MENQATSYLIFVHVNPIPEDQDAVALERSILSVAEVLMPQYDVEITAAWISDFSVISLEDLDNLPTTETTST